MRLTAVKPSQDVIDRLVLDAAWERVSQVETELLQSRHVAKMNRESYERANTRRLKLELAIGGLMTKLRGNPDMSVDSIVDELREMLDEAENYLVVE